VDHFRDAVLVMAFSAKTLVQAAVAPVIECGHSERRISLFHFTVSCRRPMTMNNRFTRPMCRPQEFACLHAKAVRLEPIPVPASVALDDDPSFADFATANRDVNRDHGGA
jgi:hypothetical protein